MRATVRSFGLCRVGSPGGSTGGLGARAGGAQRGSQTGGAGLGYDNGPAKTVIGKD